jgi:hypothetical protein
MGVTSLQLFGSAGRDELTPTSDVDALVEFGRPVGAFTFVDGRDFLARVLGRDVGPGDARRAPPLDARARSTGLRACCLTTSGDASATWSASRLPGYQRSR